MVDAESADLVLIDQYLRKCRNCLRQARQLSCFKNMVFFIPGTDSKIFQGARRVFTFHIEIFSLLSELANSVMKRSKCEKWKLFKPLEKFKRKGLGWVKCFLRLIEVYLYAIINYFNLPRKVDSCKEILNS